jgi:hypothetical protein
MQEEEQHEKALLGMLDVDGAVVELNSEQHAAASTATNATDPH